MSKITATGVVAIGTELIFNEVARTFQLAAGVNLTAKDGITCQVIYSEAVDLWATSEYQDSPFPFNAIDALSGQYQIGVDAGGNFNGWKPADDTTRQMMRDGGWEEYNNSGTLLRVYSGIVGLGGINVGAQPYFIRSIGDTPTNFTFDDQANEAIQVFGDAANGNFDTRLYFKGYVREQGKKFSDSILADTGKTATGPFIVNLLLSNEDDLSINADDTAVQIGDYIPITVTYGSTTRTIGGVSYNFNVIIEGNGQSLKSIYTKVQYLLRQNSDIDTGAGTMIGQTADLLCGFVGDTLETTVGVYVDNIDASFANSIKFKDTGGTFRTNPFVAAGNMSFNTALIGAGSSYRLMYTTGPGALDDYGEAGAITVKDADGIAITGVVTASSTSFTFDYDGDAEGGTAGTDKPVTLIGINPGTGKFAVATGTLTASKNNALALVAETDRAYQA